MRATNVVPRVAQTGSLWTEGYLLVRKLLTSSSAERLSSYVLGLRELNSCSDNQVPGAPAKYGDRVMDQLLETLLPRIEVLANLRLYATYSYCRVYRGGDSLARHTDRPACEVSVSISLSCCDAPFWPLWVQGLRQTFAAELSPGDGLVYLGVRCPHWREPFAGREAAQVFLHYVAQDGPFNDCKFDKRPGLSHRVHTASQTEVGSQL
jgi:hypothetical protein